MTSPSLRIGRFGLSEPVSYEPGAEEVAQAIHRHIGAFTGEWQPSTGDPGDVLIQLFAEMALEAGDGIRGMPEKSRVELLRVAGIDPLPATPARALVVFNANPTAPESVLIPQGFQLGARPATEGELVIFETERALRAAPGKIAELLAVRGSGFRDLTAQNNQPSTGFQPFGLRPRLGDALLLGLDGQNAPSGSIAIGVGLRRPSGSPRPVSDGGLYPVPTEPAVQLSWDALDAAKWLPLEPIRDETGQLSRSGVIELRLPDQFRPGRPTQLATGPLRRWIRVRLVAGEFGAPPIFDFVRINAVGATAGRTVFDEVLQPIERSNGRTFRLSQSPVLGGSLYLEVNDGSGFRSWRQVDDLLDSGPLDEVYVLDAASGTVTFGDDTHGRAVPEGLRQVRARAYRVGRIAAAIVKADAIKSLLGSVDAVSGVTNPRAAGGGDPQEGNDRTVRRGPDMIRTHRRTVLPADYELLALRSPGARVRRVHAMPGRHPAMTATVIPGVVGLLLVPPLEDGGLGGPPLPDEETLQNVVRHVTTRLAPVGVEVVAGAPVYHPVRIETQVRLATGIDQGLAITEILASLDTYLHPLTGGEDGEGWPFGAPLRYQGVLRRLLSLTPIQAVPRLSMIVDGRRVPRCQDRAIGPHDLLWPLSHLVMPVEAR